MFWTVQRADASAPLTYSTCLRAYFSVLVACVCQVSPHNCIVSSSNWRSLPTMGEAVAAVLFTLPTGWMLHCSWIRRFSGSQQVQTLQSRSTVAFKYLFLQATLLGPLSWPGRVYRTEPRAGTSQSFFVSRQLLTVRVARGDLFR